VASECNHADGGGQARAASRRRAQLGRARRRREGGDEGVELGCAGLGGGEGGGEGGVLGYGGSESATSTYVYIYIPFDILPLCVYIYIFPMGLGFLSVWTAALTLFG